MRFSLNKKIKDNNAKLIVIRIFSIFIILIMLLSSFGINIIDIKNNNSISNDVDTSIVNNKTGPIYF